MYFKELELVGFKSFAEKTKLHFGPGVTAIVGPNGCGKTNLVDAIKWVLGEQSPKELRGGQMEDVIFNGTDKRLSLGMAEVSLTLANPTRFLPIDYEEVTVTRRIFRSGESLYFLNKTPCRLKDIVELFMGTGIGTNSYSLLAQGQVDVIINSKPEDRRFLFEEVAGITKYKSKKKEASNKLVQTEQNLIRVNDIINEVRRQISSIERQVKKAQRYQQDFEKLKDLELKVGSFEYQKLKTKLSQSKEEGQSYFEQESLLATEIKGRQKEIDDLVNERDHQAELSSTSHERALSLESSIEKNNHLISLNKERINELTAQRKNLEDEIELRTKKIQGLKVQIKQQEERKASLVREKNGQESLLVKNNENIKSLSDQISLNQKNIERLKIEVMDLASEIAKSRNELAKVSVDLQNSYARQRRLRIEREKVEKEKREDILKKVTQTSFELKQLKQNLTNLKNEESSIQSKQDEVRGEISALKERLQENKNGLSLKCSQKDLLEDLKKRYEGFEIGPKSILLGRDQGSPELAGVIGSISEVISITEGYEAAIETALGSHIQSIIVNSADNAKKAVKYLRANDLGRATFFPKDLVGLEEDVAYQVLPKVVGILGKATDFVQCDPQFNGVISYLLRHTFVVKDLTVASNSKVELKGCRLVTLYGEMVGPGNEMTGGSIPRVQGDSRLIGRRDQIERLISQIEELKIEIDRDTKELVSKAAILEDLKKQSEKTEKLIHDAEIRLSNVESENMGLEMRNKKLDEEVALLNLEQDEADSKVDELKRQQTDCEEKLKNFEVKNEEIQNLIVSSQDTIAKCRKEREDLLVGVARVKTEIASFGERQMGINNASEMLMSSLSEQDDLVKSKRTQITASQRKEEELSSEIEDLKTQIQTFSSSKAYIEQEIAKFQEERQKLLQQISTRGNKLKEGQDELDRTRDKARSFGVTQTELSYKANAIKDRISQAYKVDLDGIVEMPDEVLDLEGINKQILDMKSHLERMGPVNLVAIDEHEELKERLSFLTNQQQDLEKAKLSLYTAIRKINRTARELFMETFSKVQVAFKELFCLLFDGGEAQLILSDQSDILESGIEVIARPPGKRLQNISLLSGGEKALTAVAMLFALFKIKPSPFCVMDEADGPLDEANIDRFTKVLRDFLKASQFIIITHNKKTITMADVMYGVTMEESGVSKLVGVKLADLSNKIS